MKHAVRGLIIPLLQCGQVGLWFAIATTLDTFTSKRSSPKHPPHFDLYSLPLVGCSSVSSSLQRVSFPKRRNRKPKIENLDQNEEDPWEDISQASSTQGSSSFWSIFSDSGWLFLHVLLTEDIFSKEEEHPTGGRGCRSKWGPLGGWSIKDVDQDEEDPL